MLAYLVTLIISYLLGSIPFGFLLTKYAGMGDIRSIGSGNIGATNVLRTGNKKLAALTLFLDGFKGFAAVLLIQYFFPHLGALAGLGAILGHIFPVWLKFKGGKGVITSVGVITALSWPIGVLTMLIWTLMAKFSKYSSLSALVAIGVLPFLVFLRGRGDMELLSLAIVALVFWKHSANIRRLIAGTEPKIGQDKKATPASDEDI
ncbi:MAG: glycerol-3-phosphate 1-O-acyltransferase PlsY [Alphaproteobacteria bacterium]